MIYTLHVHQTMVKNQNYKWVLKSVAKNSTSDRYVEYPDKVIKELPVSGKICNLNPDMITHDFGRTIKKLGLPHFRSASLCSHNHARNGCTRSIHHGAWWLENQHGSESGIPRYQIGFFKKIFRSGKRIF